MERLSTVARGRVALQRLRGSQSGWSIADQGLSSATNFLVTFAVARYAGAEDFGYFSLAYTAMLVVLAITRGLVATPYMIEQSDGGTGRVPVSAARAAMGAACAVGLAGGLLVAALLPLVPLTGRALMIASAVVLPVVVVQDTARFVLLAASRARSAAGIDAVWAGSLMLALIMWAQTDGGLTASVAMALWGGGAAASLLPVARDRWARPDVRGSRLFLADVASSGWRFAVDNGLKVIVRLAVLMYVASMLSIVAVGALRGAQEVLGVMRPLLVAFPTVLVPVGVRAARSGASRVRRICLGMSVGLVGLVGAWCVVVMLAGGVVGPILLGQTWPSAQPAVPPTAVATMLAAMAVPFSFGLRALNSPEGAMRARLVSVGALAVAGWAGTLSGRVVDLAWALAGAELVTFIGAWVTFEAACRRWDSRAEGQQVSLR